MADAPDAVHVPGQRRELVGGGDAQLGGVPRSPGKLGTGQLDGRLCSHHCAPSGVVQEINPSYGTDELTDFLEMVSQRCKFAYWFFGHYHENRIIDQKYILQWEKISELGF